MIRLKQHHRERQYRPQAAKTLRQALVGFITREFPRLGGPWVIALFVDKLLEVVDAYRTPRECLKPGQTVWSAVAVDEHPGYRKPMTHTRQVPVVVAVASQEDIAALRANVPWPKVLKRALVRAANAAYSQGGVLSCTDLSVLFHRGQGCLLDYAFRPFACPQPRYPTRRNPLRILSNRHIYCAVTIEQVAHWRLQAAIHRQSNKPKTKPAFDFGAR